MSCPYLNGSDETCKKEEDGKVTGRPPVHYASYLEMDKILSSQRPESQFGEGRDKPVHDEHLFIVVHQVKELWFKQCIAEIVSVLCILQQPVVDSGHMLVMATRLKRVVMIIKLFTQQFEILETMTPMDFLDFRGMLSPASGFQSLQFRVLENILGVKKEWRVSPEQHYSESHSGQAGSILRESEESQTLLAAVEKWLEGMPGLEDFEQRYGEVVRRIHAEKDQPVEERFSHLLDAEKHRKDVENGERRLSHKATLGALMIFLYRDEPYFQLPYQVLQLLMDIDGCLMQWRHRHVTMVQRFLGMRTGTGGSSGVQYLRATVNDRYRVFLDLFNLASVALPRWQVPPLSDKTKSLLASPGSVSTKEAVRDHPGYADANLGENMKKLIMSADGLQLAPPSYYK